MATMMLNFGLELCRLDEAALAAHWEQARRQEYTVATLATLAGDAGRVYELHQECRRRQPPLETHQEPQDVALWLRTWAAPEEGAHPELYHVLVRGEDCVGVCGLVGTDTPGEFVCGFTGILPEYSGAGLTLALKSHLLLTAKRDGVVRVRTSVHPDNQAMIRLNRRLGFTP